MLSLQKRLLLFLLSLVLPVFLFSCTNKTNELAMSEDTQVMMGTSVNVRIYHKNGSGILKEVFDKVQDIENRMSLNIETSEISKINASSGVAPVKVSAETYEVVKKGAHYGELSKGKFDISIGPLVTLWGIGSDSARLPSKEEIEATLPLINYKEIIFNDADKSIMLKKRGMKLDLGGIAKGYTADVIAGILKSRGVKKAIVNLGGNVLTIGSHPENRPWSIGLQDPFNPENRGQYLVGTIALEDKTLVTSGVYERVFEKDGKKYHHILSPFNGYPVDNGLVSLSILTDSSADADALSTSVFSMGLEEGMKFVQGLKNVDAIFITSDKRVFATPGAKKIFKITNQEFTLQD